MDDMKKSCTLTRQIVTGHVDLKNSWRASSILEFLQESAVENCIALGCGRNDLLREGLAWVVLRMEVVMDRYPELGSEVQVLTFPKHERHGMYPRYFVISDKNSGEVLGKASSVWTLLNLETRTVATSSFASSCIPDNPELVPPMDKLPPLVQPLDAESVLGTRIPTYSDLDANIHVNNVRYMDWCCDALGVSVMQNMSLSHFVVNYTQEIVPGQIIQTDLRKDGNFFTFSGSEGETQHFKIFGELKESVGC